MTVVLLLNISLILFPTVKSDLAKPTIAYTMHVSREPQDDGYTLIPSPETEVREMIESDLSLTFESCSDKSSRTKTPKEVRSPIYLFLIESKIAVTTRQQAKANDYLAKRGDNTDKTGDRKNITKGAFWIGILLSFKICLCVSEAEPDQTQTKVDGWAERTGPGGGIGKTPGAERSTQLPTQPSLPTSKRTAGWHIPHPAQRQSREDRACEERDGGEQVTGICCA